LPLVSGELAVSLPSMIQVATCWAMLSYALWYVNHAAMGS
jgi:hypothetical protein